jgi:integrase
MTFADFVMNHWRHTLDVRKQTKLDYQNSINKHILPYFGSSIMSEISPLEIRSWTAALKQEEKYFGRNLSPYTIQKYVNLMASILKSAKESDFIASSPFEKIRRKKVKPERRAMPLELGQVEALIFELPEHVQLMVWLPFLTGMRPSECLGLTFDDFDFSKKEIKISKQISRDTSKVFEPLKTETSERIIKLAPNLEYLVKEHVARHGVGPSNLLFQNRLGGVLRYKDAARFFRLAAIKVGLPERTGMHVLRHTFASQLLRQGKSMLHISKLLGHKDVSETADTYAHLYPEDLGDAILDLDATLGKISPRRPRKFGAAS